MSLLDLEDGPNMDFEFGNMWKEYEMLEEDLNNNLLEIEEIIGRKEMSVSCQFKNISLKSNIAVGAALIWWYVAINLMRIHTYQENRNRLQIAWY